MNNNAKVLGVITQTTPASTPLDTLKALVLRNIDHLEYVIDQLAGGVEGIPEHVLDFLDHLKLIQYEALAEHVHVAADERIGELRHIHPDGYSYDDGTPVVERFEARYGTSIYYPRYGGSRDEAIARHQEWVQQVETRVTGDAEFDNIVRDVEWGGDK